ncbi:MAG: hypothetical protein LBQ30_07415 [Treponema sp.]|jgi:hypothetical protein|nr:hypothetical protein [Treponema sp.]
MFGRNGLVLLRVLIVSAVIGGMVLACTQRYLPVATSAVKTDSPSEIAPDLSDPLDPPDAISASTAWMRPLVIIQSGDNPLWFELGAEGASLEGLRLIQSPAEASLKPFAPWPLVQSITGMVIQEDRLTLGVNREGFLIARPEQEQSIGIYRIADPSYWGNYTIGSLLLFEGEPAALLYRDDFFVEPSGVPPNPRVLAAVKGSTQPVSRAIPALEQFPAAEGWDVETLRQGQDGSWYYRGIQRSAVQPERVYMRTADLFLPGEAVPVSEFRNSALPEPLDQAPPVLYRVLDAALGLSGQDQVPVAAIISPEFSVTRHFAADTALTENPEQVVQLAGYYSQTSTGPQALVILPDGSGIRSLGEDRITAFSCPPLPEGFVYTRIGPVGDALIAAWEEQQGWNGGAAGLMIIRLERP